MPTDHGSNRIAVSEVRKRLQSLTQSISQLPTVSQPPETTLAVLGEARTEAYWEALLEYFLDPSAPHGFQSNVLEAFLTVVAADSESTLSPRAHTLSKVHVASQVGADDGVPDLLLWVPEEWFCCIELKAHSGESNDQTIRYAESRELGPLTVKDYPESNHHYLYLAPAGTPPPASSSFVELDWEDVVPAFRELIVADRGRYPAKSHAQFADYIDTLEDELGMTDYEEYEREKVELAIKHGDAITTVQRAVENFVSEELDDWRSDFESAAPSGWTGVQGGQKYPRLHYEGWYFDESGRVDTADGAGIVFAYVSQLDVETILNRNLTIGFKRISGADDKLEEQAYDALYAEKTQARLEALAMDHDLTIFGRTENVEIFETPVSINIGAGETVGGQFAERIRDLEQVNAVIEDALTEAFT